MLLGIGLMSTWSPSNSSVKVYINRNTDPIATSARIIEGQSTNPIRTATHPKRLKDEYGTYKAITIDSFIMLDDTCSISPSFTIVMVAAGASMMVLVTVTGVPRTFGEGEEGEESEVELKFPVAVEFEGDALIIDVGLVCMHPFGEQTSSAGQHPPPVSAEHTTIEDMQAGGFFSSAWHWYSVSVELQQKMPDGVRPFPL